MVFTALPLRNQLEGSRQGASMIRVRSGAGGDLAQQIASRDGVGVGAANPLTRPRRNAAGAHVAEAAAHAGPPELALRLLALVAIPSGRDLLDPRNLHHFVDGAIAGDLS